jgi:hypothetical protein
MASQHTTPESDLSRISPLELGAIEHDMHDQALVERMMGDLCDENQPLANMLLELAEREEELPDPDSRQKVAIKYALMIYGLVKRKERIDDLEKLLGLTLANEVEELSA